MISSNASAAILECNFPSVVIANFLIQEFTVVWDTSKGDWTTSESEYKYKWDNGHTVSISRYSGKAERALRDGKYGVLVHEGTCQRHTAKDRKF